MNDIHAYSRKQSPREHPATAPTGTAPAEESGMPRAQKTPVHLNSSARGEFRIGYVPLIDAAPLIVADELGLFRDAGLDIHLSSELGWGSIREKIVYGELDAAHAPGGLLFSILLGRNSPACPVFADLVLNLQGNAITLSRRLWQKGVRDARTLRLTFRSESPRRPVFAVVSAHSSHPFLLREWLRSAGLHPDRDVRIVVLPPQLVGEQLREGLIEGFCVGEPWSSEAAINGDGWVIETSASLAPDHPEKVLLVRESARARQPDAYRALRAAIVEAAAFCDADRPAVARILHRRRTFPHLPEPVLLNSLVGPYRTGVATLEEDTPFLRFHRGNANAATRDRAEWCIEALADSGTLKLDAPARRLCFDAFQLTELTKPKRPARNQLVTA